MVLFDTDVISHIFKPHPPVSLMKRIGRLAQHEQFISTITISEIVYGAMKSGRVEYHLKNLEEILLPSVNIVGFDAKSAYICGRIRAGLEKKGMPLSLADLEIAAIAMANELTLITGNTKHFQRIEGLRMENWLQ